MSKITVNMTNWELYAYDGNYMLSGTADNHPLLGKNTYVSRTSSLVDYSFTDDVLTYETRNTIYVCPLKYMIVWPYKSVVAEHIEKLLHMADSSDSVLDRIIVATAKLSIKKRREEYNNLGKRNDEYYDDICKISYDYTNDELLHHIIELQKQGQIEIAELNQREYDRLINLACNYDDCIYIEVSNVGCGSLLAYHLGESKGIVSPYLHSGMFQNSVLYIRDGNKDDPCCLDFRYFPKGVEDIIETYSWSDNIAKAVIKNDTNRMLKFNKEDISVGETVIFTPDGHRQTLISPDHHNGKSWFNNN